MRDFWRTSLLAAAVVGVLLLMARTNGYARDLTPLAATLIAFREMDWFTRPTDHHLENTWVMWDRSLLSWMGPAIEGLRAAGFLELCYVLVYAVGPVSLAILLLNRRRDQVNRFWLAYLAGTLGAYALFPYFPSQPPRILFPDADLPVLTMLRRFNLFILGNYSIHSSVFPSAHVSSAFSAAWVFLSAIPERRYLGWAMALYAFCVSIATIYGRYHYAADAAAGLAMSLLAAVVLRWIKE